MQSLLKKYLNKHKLKKDANKMTTILGIHLVLLGLGAGLLVVKAVFFGGLYDSNIGEVRVISHPT